MGSLEEQNYNEFITELEHDDQAVAGEEMDSQHEEEQQRPEQEHVDTSMPNAGAPRKFGPLGQVQDVREPVFEGRRERRHREEKVQTDRRRQMLSITDAQRPQEQQRQHLLDRPAAEALEKEESFG